MASVQTPDLDRSSLDQLQWYRKLETFGENDAVVLASGPCGETKALWWRCLVISEELELMVVTVSLAR